VKTFACAACYGGNIDSPMADGMNWAILTLGAIVATVLGAFLTFLIYAIRKSEALTAAAERKNSPAQSKA
jgi:heme/copper-type cytochrome/quinol oxidase subunit 2